jgi:hypothetical protein
MHATRRRFVWFSVGVMALAAVAIGLFFHSQEVRLILVRLPSGPLFIAEDPDHPELRALRRQEHLDRFVQPRRPELENLFALAQWAHAQFPAGSPFQNYPPWNARTVLKMIRSHQTGGFCAQYAQVFGQACQSFGYGVRYVGIVTADARDGHVVTEVYAPSYSRWMIMDATREEYYTDSRNVPLNVMEMHQYAVGERRGIVWRMPAHQPADPALLALYYHFKYALRNNFLSVPMYWYRKPMPGGTLEIFEPYELRWVDAYTQHVKEGAPALTSSRKEDFNFSFDWKDLPVVRCKTLDDFQNLLLHATPGKPFRVSLPKRALVQFTEGVLVPDRRFQPLK